MVDRVLPDFNQIADNVVDREELSSLLKELYYQGYHAGKIDGEESWTQELDKAFDDGYYRCYNMLTNKVESNG